MPATSIRILRESLNLARYAAAPIIVEDRPQANPAWLNGLRARLIGLLARVDAEIAGDMRGPAACDSWSDDEQRLFVVATSHLSRPSERHGDRLWRRMEGRFAVCRPDADCGRCSNTKSKGIGETSRPHPAA